MSMLDHLVPKRVLKNKNIRIQVGSIVTKKDSSPDVYLVIEVQEKDCGLTRIDPRQPTKKKAVKGTHWWTESTDLIKLEDPSPSSLYLVDYCWYDIRRSG